MYYFIVNPNSSSGRGLKIWKKCQAYLHEQHIAYQVFFTQKPGHAITLANDLTKMASSSSSPVTVIAMGGDGTINEVVNGLIPFTNIILGYIPSGSGNDFNRGLRFSSTPLEALKRILHPEQIAPMNVLQCRFNDIERAYVDSCGIGFDALVCYKVEHSRLKRIMGKLGLGKLVYLGIALKELLLMKTPPMKIQYDDQCMDLPAALFSACMNLPYEGGGFQFCPDADAFDDTLDLCVLERISRFRIPYLLPLALVGKHKGHRGVHLLKCKHAAITTTEPLAIHMDGEAAHFTDHIEFSLLSHKLQMIIR